MGKGWVAAVRSPELAGNPFALVLPYEFVHMVLEVDIRMLVQCFEIPDIFNIQRNSKNAGMVAKVLAIDWVVIKIDLDSLLKNV